MAIRYCDWTNGQDFSIQRDRTTAIAAWSAATTYGLNAFAHNNAAHPNRKCYKSLQAANTNHALTDGTWWTMVADGTYTYPFQSTTDASQGLTGGDEVRVAKSPDNTALSGTLTFTAGSTTLTGSSTAFTTELAIGDFVLGGDSVPYEVITISSNTAAVLYKKYPSSTQSGVACVKVGMISTGAAAASTTQVQVISSSGTSANANMMISGGWDLATQNQTGFSNFKQMHGTFANRYGYGLYATGKNYVTIEKCNFFRYETGIYLFNNSNYNNINTVVCNSNNYALYLYNNVKYNNITNGVFCSNGRGIYTDNASYSSFTTVQCNSNTIGAYITASSNGNIIRDLTCNYNSSYGCYLTSSEYNTIISPTCNSNPVGIIFTQSVYNTINSPTCNSNTEQGIYISSKSNNNTINSPTCNSNTTNAFYTDNSFVNIVNKFSGTGKIGVTLGTTVQIIEIPQLSIQYYNAKGVNINWFYQGITESNTAEADGGSGTCLHYDPSSATLYMSHSFLFKAVDNTAYTITAKVKKKNSFNGDVQGAVFFLGVPVIDWADITPTNADAYETKTFNVTQAMVTDNSCLELRIKVRGTAGDIYVDTLGIS